jgi:hypothetical protein
MKKIEKNELGSIYRNPFDILKAKMQKQLLNVP